MILAMMDLYLSLWYDPQIYVWVYARPFEWGTLMSYMTNGGKQYIFMLIPLTRHILLHWLSKSANYNCFSLSRNHTYEDYVPLACVAMLIAISRDNRHNKCHCCGSHMLCVGNYYITPNDNDSCWHTYDILWHTWMVYPPSKSRSMHMQGPLR